MSGPLLVIVSFVVSVVAFAITTWIIATLILVGTVMLIFLFTFVHAAYNSHKNAANPLPSILYSEASEPGELSELTCLLEPSELFSQDILVSFYVVREEGLEVLIGVGEVDIVQQEDGKIRVSLTFPVEGYREDIDKLKGNNAAALKRTRVKPTVPKKYLIRSILSGGP